MTRDQPQEPEPKGEGTMSETTSNADDISTLVQQAMALPTFDAFSEALASFELNVRLHVNHEPSNPEASASASRRVDRARFALMRALVATAPATKRAVAPDCVNCGRPKSEHIRPGLWCLPESRVRYASWIGNEPVAPPEMRCNVLECNGVVLAFDLPGVGPGWRCEKCGTCSKGRT